MNLFEVDDVEMGEEAPWRPEEGLLGGADSRPEAGYHGFVMAPT